MSIVSRRSRSSGVNRRSVALVIIGVSLLVAANVHFVYVALISQPDCVPHTKLAGENGAFRAARSAC